MATFKVGDTIIGNFEGKARPKSTPCPACSDGISFQSHAGPAPLILWFMPAAHLFFAPSHISADVIFHRVLVVVPQGEWFKGKITAAHENGTYNVEHV